MFLRKYIILLSLIVTTNGFSGQFDARVIKVIDEIGRAHVRTPVTEKSRMPSSA